MEKVTNMMDALRTENAEFARDVEYLKQIAIDDDIDQRTEAVEADITESSADLIDAAKFINSLDISDIDAMESAEVGRILNSDDDLSFNEMTGLE